MAKPVLRVAYTAGVTPAKWARIWAQRHPQQPLELIQTDDAGQFSVIEEGGALLAFVRLAAGDEPDLSGLHLIPLYQESPVVVVPKDHVLAAEQTVTLAEIDALADGPIHTFDAQVAESIALVAAGVGVVVVPHSIARLHARRDVVAREVSDGAATRIGLAWSVNADQHDADAIEEFVGIVRGRTANSSRGSASEAGGAKREARAPGRDRSGSARDRGSAGSAGGRAGSGFAGGRAARKHPRKRRP